MIASLEHGEGELTTPEGTLHYTIVGSGPVCIALSGGPGLDPRYLETLGGLEDFLTLVVAHPRGAGLSRFASDSDWSLAAYARDVDALRRHLGVELPLVLGHSHGGWIAQRYAIDYPTGVGGLILLGTAPCGLGVSGWDAEAEIARYSEQPWFASARDALVEELGPDATPEQAVANLEAIFPFYFARLSPDVLAYLARVRPVAVNPAPSARGNGPEQFSADWRAQLPSVQAPTLVMVGRDDFIQTPAMAEELARLIPRAQLVVFEQSGHFPWVEERERFRAVLRDFVRTLG